MSLYQFIDHRAPGYLPHNTETHQMETSRFGWNGVFFMVTLFVGLPFVFLGWAFALIPILMTAAAITYNVQFSRWVHNINGPDYYEINKYMTELQGIYRNNYPSQKMLEPLLIGAYDAAKKNSSSGVYERLQLARQYVSEFGSISARRDDIENFKTNMETLRGMKKEGLL